MLLIPVILKVIGKKLIRFKSNSELDNFVFVWHFSYRVANLLIIILSGSLLNTFEEVTNSPRDAINKLASGISQQSQFFLNNMIVAAGSENLWELAQVRLHYSHKMSLFILSINKYRTKKDKLTVYHVCYIYLFPDAKYDFALFNPSGCNA
jgi:hypothetical protein